MRLPIPAGVDTFPDRSPAPYRNRLLRALFADGVLRHLPGLEPVRLTAGARLQTALEPIDTLYFPESGMVSCYAGSRGRDQTEVALIGREGMVGLARVLGAAATPFDFVVRREGNAYRLPSDRLDGVAGPISALAMRYAYALSVQIAETGRANARQTVEARLARWLLMAHDRADGSEIGLTHETLSTILGVRRPGVTVALHVLEGEHVVRARRGAVEILDRAGLMRAANGSYGGAEREYERVLGSGGPAPAAPTDGAPPRPARPAPGAG